MTALLVVVLCLLFVLADLLVREWSKRRTLKRERRERESVLETALQLTFASETLSLKRAEVPNARARILAVDDEPVVLDSFRKILVMAGLSVDTVETGPEALTLLRQRDYDLLFTDLKMPGMDGVEVVKSATHLRPDLDVAVITGYATIESAVETMRFGAADYVQKPFTEEELSAFANRLLIRRQARLEAQRRPTVRIVAPAVAETVAAREFCVPGGAFISAGHTWARIDTDGEVWSGVDDFARKALRSVERVELPGEGTVVRRGDCLATLRLGDQVVRMPAPLGGEITQVNPLLEKHPELLVQSPYDRGWLCLIRPARLAEDLAGLRIGKPVVAWYHEEIDRLRRETAKADRDELTWAQLQSRFFELGPGPTAHSGEEK